MIKILKADSMKTDLIRLLKGMKDVPKYRQAQHQAILKLLEDKNTVIPLDKKSKAEVSVFIASLFCSVPKSKRDSHPEEGIIPINRANIRMVRSFSDTHLQENNVILLQRPNGKPR